MDSPIVQVRFPPALLERIDAARGNRSRSEWLREAASRMLAMDAPETQEWTAPAAG